MVFTEFRMSAFLIFCFWTKASDSADSCSKTTAVGKDKAMTMTDHADPGTGLLSIMYDTSYFIPCCGFIEKWHLHINSAGSIQLQVWRSLSNGSYLLIGENRAYFLEGEENDEYELPIDVDDQIAVQSGDLIGWYNEGKSMVPYVKERNGHGAIAEKVHPIAKVGESLDLSGSKLTEPRGYAIELFLRKPNQIKFANLNSDLTLEHNLVPKFEVFTVIVEGWHSDKTSPHFEVRLDSFDEYFDFNSSSGAVFLKATPPLGKYTLSFTLTDHCGTTTSGTLKITVNVKFPQIENLPDHVSVREDIQNTEVLVKELSVLSDGPLSCGFKSIVPKEGNNMFLLRRVNGTFTVFLKATAVLNYAVLDTFVLTLQCNGDKSVDTEDLTVNVEPNSVPTFTNLPTSIVIHAADDVIGDVVYYISAQDGENNVVSFNMTCDPPHCPFGLTRGGEVFVNDDIRSVHSNIYYLEISVSDNFNTGSPELLVVNITGINRPPFITNLPADPIVMESMHENAEPGTFIYQVSVVDQDKDDTLQFMMKTHPSNMNMYFLLNETTGLITAAMSIDYEASKIKNVKIEVTVSDGKDSDKGSLRVSIVDIDEPPVFTHDRYTIYTDEGRPGAKAKSEIKAKDADKNDAILYSIRCGNETGLVSIDEKTADLTQTYGFDVDAYGTPEHTIYCNVTATDNNGLKATVPVNITIRDSDDNSPDFQLTSYLFVATRDLPIFSVLGQTEALDIDTTPANSKIIYYTVGHEDDFIIDENGTVYLVKNLSDVAIGSLFKFSVKAEDHNRNADTVPVTVVVLPGNYTTVISTFIPQQQTFLDMPENIVWVVSSVYLMLIMLGLLMYILARSFECIVRLRKNRIVSTIPPSDAKSNVLNNSIYTLSHSKTPTMSNEARRKNSLHSTRTNVSNGSVNTHSTIYSKKYRSASQAAISEQNIKRSFLTSTLLSDSLSDCPDNRSMLSLSGIVPMTKQSKVGSWKPWAISDFKRDSTASIRHANCSVNNSPALDRQNTRKTTFVSEPRTSKASDVSPNVLVSTPKLVNNKNIDF